KHGSHAAVSELAFQLEFRSQRGAKALHDRSPRWIDLPGFRRRQAVATAATKSIARIDRTTAARAMRGGNGGRIERRRIHGAGKVSFRPGPRKRSRDGRFANTRWRHHPQVHTIARNSTGSDSVDLNQRSLTPLNSWWLPFTEDGVCVEPRLVL